MLNDLKFQEVAERFMQKHISVAPMLDWTDRHCRYFHRLIAPSVWLYTEMVTTGALMHGDMRRFLRHSDEEHPVALQLGGSDTSDLAACAKMGEEAGYDEINLNCGCPSNRVQSGSFGACLMNTPDIVRDGVKAMRDVVDVPVTIKSRIGIDDSPEYTFLEDFVGTVAESGCDTFIIHARKAWLQGLSPKENRDIPPLQYEVVERIKDTFPDLKFPVNGGIRTIEDTKEKLELFDGVMIGREVYQNPWFLREVEKTFYGANDLLGKEEIIEKMISYIKKQHELYETPMKSITRHMIGLFQGVAGARGWRQGISTLAHKPETQPEFLLDIMPR